MKIVKENINFERTSDPFKTLNIGIFPKYLDEFVEELDRIKGKSGFPWCSYSDYVYEEFEENPKLFEKLKKLFREGLSITESVEKMKRHFISGLK